jgi:hypothetical protein
MDIRNSMAAGTDTISETTIPADPAANEPANNVTNQAPAVHGGVRRH